MSSKGYRERVLEVYEPGTALVSSTTQTSLLPASSLDFTLGAGALKIGKAIAFLFSGQITTRGTAADTLKLTLRLGTVDVLDSLLMPLTASALTNVHWVLEGEILCRAVGQTTVTTFIPKGCKWTSHAVIGAPAASAGGAPSIMLPYNAAPVVGAGLDFNVSQSFNLMATHSVNNASQSIQLLAGHVEVITGG